MKQRLMLISHGCGPMGQRGGPMTVMGPACKRTLIGCAEMQLYMANQAVHPHWKKMKQKTAQVMLMSHGSGPMGQHGGPVTMVGPLCEKPDIGCADMQCYMANEAHVCCGTRFGWEDVVGEVSLDQHPPLLNWLSLRILCTS